jgi:nitroreductase
MDVFEAIKKRFSYRGEYRDEPIPRDDLRKILEAGLAAPSASNKQTTSLIALDDSKLVNSIIDIMGKNGFQGKTSPAGVCVLSRQIPGYANKYFNVQDYAAAIENMLIAVTALGYASCWVEGQITESSETQKRIANILNVPEEYIVVAFLPVGVPKNEGKRPRYKAFSERAWFNAFMKE